MIRRFARPYARAIMDVVQSPEKATAVRAELTRFDEALKSSTELQDLYANPGIEYARKAKITQTIAIATPTQRNFDSFSMTVMRR